MTLINHKRESLGYWVSSPMCFQHKPSFSANMNPDCSWLETYFAFPLTQQWFTLSY